MRHEIKNILFPIQGFAEILLLTENDKLDDNQKNYLQIIRDDSLRAGQLVDRLKMLQDIEKGTFTLNLQKYPLKLFIEKAIVDLKMLSDEAGVSIKRDFRESPDIDVDANLIQGVFTNLLKNAIEHVQDCEHEEEKVVTVALYPHRGKTIATFNNKGEIIPPDKLKVFFKKFNTDRTKKKEGTGLGTTYAYLITQAHGGDIFVESNEDDGTTVTVSFDAT